jgi:branched-chain amino acid transport system permease protein
MAFGEEVVSGAPHGTVRLGITSARDDAPQTSVHRKTSPRRVFIWAVLVVAFVAAPGYLFSNVFVLQLGNVLIAAIAAMGLHVLVNWTGELSLAQGAAVGLPGLAVAEISATHSVDPLLLIPVAIAIGAAFGAVIGLPALRATGLFVAVVTLAAQEGVQSFFYNQAWLVGTGGQEFVATPTLGPFIFTSNNEQYPFLAAVFVVAIIVLRQVYHSKVGRGWLWIRENQQAAAAAGIPVATYRLYAYIVAGAFGGLAGALAASWVGVLSPSTYTLDQSLSYLFIVVIGGPGFVGGVICAAFILTGGNLVIPQGIHLLDYLGPIGLVVTLTTAKGGFNQAGREMRSLWRRRRHGHADIGSAPADM